MAGWRHRLPQKDLIIDDKHNHADRNADLRGRAEEQARQEAAQHLEDPAIVSPEDARKLLRELRVREIELAMQSEELRRMQSEIEALRQSDSVHRLLADNSVDMISRHAADGTALYVSPACKLITGYTVEELLGKPAEYLLFSEDVERVWSVVEAAQASKESWYLVEHRLPRKDGANRWVETMGRLIRDGEGRVYEIQCNVRDITKRRQAEEALRESEDRYRSIVSSMSDLIFVMDEEDRIIDVHCQSPEPLMMPPDEFLGKTMVDVIPGNVYELYRACMSHVRQFGENGRYEYSLPIHGETRWFAASLDLHPDGRRLVAGVRDVTERRRAEEALKKAHDELEQRVEERTAELSKANARLRRRRRTLKHMVRASDHERRLIAYEIHDGLAQELAGAIMQFQIYEHQKDAQPENAQRTFAGGMALLRQSHREARRLISGVRPPILDESGVLAAIAHLAHDPAFDHGPKVDFRSRVTFHRLEPVAENVIYRIVQEGLSNARTHSQSDKIRVSIVERGHRLRIEVRDWGVGFDPQDLQENRFGLEGIRERARLLGGKCYIRSAPGRGTTVVVEMPVIPPQENPP